MKENMIWLFLWCKRLIQKPLLLFTILLMPFTVIFLQHCHMKEDAMLRVALYTPDSTEGLVEEITALSDSSIHFYLCDSREQLLQAVQSREANCGYLIPAHLEEHLMSYVQDRKPFLTVIRGKDDVTTKIVDEIILSKNFRDIAYHILENFLENHTDTEVDKKQLTQTFDSYYSDELLFQFQYLSGEENTILQEKNTSILMLPLRGIIAVMLLLACMAGELLCFKDRLEGRYDWMSQKQRRLSSLYSLLLPGTAACICALISIKIAGISGNLLREIPAMACYLFACLGLVVLLGRLLCRQNIYLAAMPVILLLSLLLPPIFIDAASLIPAVGKLNLLLPTTWYLKSIQSPQNLLSLLAYGGICLLAAKFLQHRSLPYSQ